MTADAVPKIRALVVDDEPLARKNLTVLLGRAADVEIVGECDSGAGALEAIRSNRPDLVFLDVQMPECDGFDVLELLGGEVPAAVVFVTAHDKYALKAFEAGALDYLLKPFDNARFQRALERARERVAQRHAKSSKPDRIVVKSTGSVVFVKVGEIDWIEAADYYACLHTGKKSYLLRRSMAELEHDLDEARFCRIHRSAIVNLDRVRELRFGRDGEYEVSLEDGTSLRLSRRYRKALQARLGQDVRAEH
jgi:two-component system, LytTR family, response regulator